MAVASEDMKVSHNLTNIRSCTCLTKLCRISLEMPFIWRNELYSVQPFQCCCDTFLLKIIE
uniref:Uncharacterized protein n=1 Tax=Arundo donax TaxID=35708 RepID=A0A0A8Z5T3_ARUDO